MGSAVKLLILMPLYALMLFIASAVTVNEKLPSIANLIELIPKQTPTKVSTLGKI